MPQPVPNKTRHVKLTSRLIKRLFGYWTFTCAVVAVTVVATLGLAFVLDEEWVWQKDTAHIRDLLFVQDGQSAVVLFATFSMNGLVPLQSGVCIQKLNSSRPDMATALHDLNPSCLAARGSGDSLIIGEWSGRIWLSNTFDELPIAVGQHPNEGVEAVALCQDGTCLVSKGPRSVYAWDIEARSLMWRRVDLSVECFAVHPRTQTIVCGTTTGHLTELDVLSGGIIRQRRCHAAPLRSLAFDRTGDCLASISGDGVIAVRRWSDLSPVWERLDEGIRRSGSRVLAFSECGKSLITAGGDCGTSLFIRDAERGDLVSTFAGHTRSILGVRFVNSQTLCSWSLDGTARTWDVVAGASVYVSSIGPSRAPNPIVPPELQLRLSNHCQK